jgi:hypothetical protein
MKKEIIEFVLKEAFKKKAWFPAKEDLIYFEELERKQERIYPDAADEGFIIDDKKQAEARKHIKELLDTYNAKITKGPGKDTTTEMFIPFEQDEDFYMGVIMKIYYHEGGKNRTDRRKPKYDPSFLNIYFTRHKQKDFKYKKGSIHQSSLFPF